MIASGEKTEEYRELKDYWIERIAVTHKDFFWEFCPDVAIRPFTHIEFTNGYGNHRPQMTFECAGIEIGTGKQEWGAEPNTEYFVIKLGKEINRKNF